MRYNLHRGEILYVGVFNWNSLDATAPFVKAKIELSAQMCGVDQPVPCPVMTLPSEFGRNYR